MQSVQVFYALLAAAVVLAVRRHLRWRRDNPAGLPLPPGPVRLPMVGSLFSIKDIGSQWLTFAEWGKKYGGLIYLEILGSRILVLHSEEVAQELLDKRSQNYSDRPQVPMVTLMGWEFNVGFLRYGASWRKHRKAMHQALNPQAMLSYRDIQLRQVHQMARNLLEVPEKMEEHIRTFTASTIMTVVYGYKMAPQNDLFASIADRASEMLTNSFFPGAALVNAFPALRYLPEWCPGAGFKKFARECRKLTRELRDKPYNFVQQQRAEGIAPHSMVLEMLEHNEEEVVIKSVAGTTYAASVETSSSALSAFVLAMLKFPSVQKKAQAEIDRVTGGLRLPDFTDRPSMIYLEATYREVLRWCQVTPLGVPHMTTEDDVYNGYFIPKDTIVLANIWAMTHNEEKYPDPMRFMPERFIAEDGSLTDDLGEIQFGFGRRICVGKYLAEAAVWIAMVTILAAFDVNKAKDEFGNDIDVEPEFTPGVIIHPKPYPFSISPRSPHAAGLVRNPDS
ncbi:CyP450 monooxygenase [Pisolithus thermaeus]|nr:CyP450 monooxygenase [Pisolithus croceorrhizus]KAI6165744.1 CyP450 monooxygenase [Pisolithus thermaeus]